MPNRFAEDVMVKDRKKDMWDVFDRKVVLYFTGNKGTRVDGMESELERVGLSDADRQWNFPNPLDKVLLRNLGHIPSIERGGYMNCTMGHYRAISTAYHMGCRSVLIMEDDIRFLIDIGEIEKVLESMPADYDLVMLDYFYRHCDKKTGCVERWKVERKVNDDWAEFDMMHSAGCYALSKRGMERILNCYHATTNKRDALRICDHYFDRGRLGEDTKMYFPVRNMCVQVDTGAANTKGSVASRYIATNVDLSKYAH